MAKTKKVRFQNRPYKHMISLLFVLLFAGVGSYFVFQSKAAELLPGDVQCGNNCHRSTSFMREVVTLTGPSTVKVEVYADLSIPELVGIHPLMAYFHHELYYNNADRDDIHPWDEKKLCIDLESQSGKKNVLIDSYTRNTPGPSKNITGSAFELYFFAVDNPKYPNINCATYLSQGGGLKEKQLNYFGLAHGVSLQQGYTPGGGDNTGNNGEGSGDKGQGSGNGGGSGGSTATSQSDKANTTPSSSSQGNKPQTEFEPSPFFDGKQYAPGSDPLDKTFGNIFVGSRSIAHGWIYIIAVLLVLLAGIAYYVLKVRKRRR